MILDAVKRRAEGELARLDSLQIVSQFDRWSIANPLVETLIATLNGGSLRASSTQILRYFDGLSDEERAIWRDLGRLLDDIQRRYQGKR